MACVFHKPMALAYSQTNSVSFQELSLCLLETQLETGFHTEVALDWSFHNDNFLTGVLGVLGQFSSKQRQKLS